MLSFILHPEPISHFKRNKVLLCFSNSAFMTCTVIPAPPPPPPYDSTPLLLHEPVVYVHHLLPLNNMVFVCLSVCVCMKRQQAADHILLKMKTLQLLLKFHPAHVSRQAGIHFLPSMAVYTFCRTLLIPPSIICGQIRTPHPIPAVHHDFHRNHRTSYTQ